MALSKKPRLLNSFIMFQASVQALMEPIHAVAVISNVANNPVPAGHFLIGTHDGSFHCDEALAISMLQLHPTYQDKVAVVRSRNPDILSNCHVVVDVGAVYDPATHRYDHHQREFQGTLEGYKTRLSSAGLVYKHFGKEILQNILKGQVSDETLNDIGFLDTCFHKVYKNFMEHIDAIDNGVTVADAELKYHISTTLSARVGHLNPEWNEPQTAEIANEKFRQAMILTGSEFVSFVHGLARSWWPARSIVQRAINSRLDIDPEGRIIKLSQACPWKDHLFELEEKDGINKIIYALYPDTGGSWRVQAVPVDPNSFHSRKKLPEVWCGVRDDALSEKTGIPGCIFVHASGFIGGHKTEEGATNMALKALDL